MEKCHSALILHISLEYGSYGMGVLFGEIRRVLLAIGAVYQMVSARVP